MSHEDLLRRESLHRLTHPPRRTWLDVPGAEMAAARNPTARRTYWAAHLAATRSTPQTSRRPVPTWFHPAPHRSLTP